MLNFFLIILNYNQVLICKLEEIKRIMSILNESCPPLHSCLSEDINGMTHAILEVVAVKIVQTPADIHRYVECTFLNFIKPFEDVVKSAQESLRWLCHGKFIEWNEDTKLYSTTPFGRAAFGSSLNPKESLVKDSTFSFYYNIFVVLLCTICLEIDYELLFGFPDCFG